MQKVKLSVMVSRETRDQLKDAAKAKGMLFGAYVESVLSNQAPVSKELAVYDNQDVVLTNLLFELMRDNNPNYTKQPTNTDYNTMRKLREIDRKDPKLIEAVIRWCQKDEFWHRNILSVSKLRKQFDRLCVEAKTQTSKRRVLSA